MEIQKIALKKIWRFRQKSFDKNGPNLMVEIKKNVLLIGTAIYAASILAGGFYWNRIEPLWPPKLCHSPRCIA